jgi:hypothetical protein
MVLWKKHVRFIWLTLINLMKAQEIEGEFNEQEEEEDDTLPQE